MNTQEKIALIMVIIAIVFFSNLITGAINYSNGMYYGREFTNKEWEIRLVKEGTHYLTEEDDQIVLKPYEKGYPSVNMIYESPSKWLITPFARGYSPSPTEPPPPPSIQEPAKVVPVPEA